MGPGGAEDTALFLLLVARYLTWTGDRPTVRGHWPAVERAYDRIHGHPGRWWPRVERPLVHAAEEVGEQALAARMRARAEAGVQAPADGGGPAVEAGAAGGGSFDGAALDTPADPWPDAGPTASADACAAAAARTLAPESRPRSGRK